jgi:hypothetical protein
VNPVLVRKSAKPTNRGFTTPAHHGGNVLLTDGDEGLLVGRHFVDDLTMERCWSRNSRRSRASKLSLGRVRAP